MTARLPDLLLIGAMKSGTSSLWTYLGGHPDVFLAARKELHYFDRAENYARGTDWYASWFAAAGDVPVVGEATPAYTRFPHVRGIPALAAQVVPDARLVYVVRDPVERIRSHYQHEMSHGMESLPFETAVLSRSQYVNVSRYAMQVERWLEHYPREQLLVVQSERLRSCRDTVLREIFTFLGVDPDHPALAVPDTETNRTVGRSMRLPVVRQAQRRPSARLVLDHVPGALKTRAKARLSVVMDGPADRHAAVLTPELRAVLGDLVRDDVRRLRAYLPEDFDGWGLA